MSASSKSMHNGHAQGVSPSSQHGSSPVVNSASAETGDDVKGSTHDVNPHVIVRRVVAALIDTVLVFVLFQITGQGGFSRVDRIYIDGEYVERVFRGLFLQPTSFTAFLLCLTAIYAYFVLLEASVGGTAGKLLLGIRVKTMRGNKIGIKQSIIRNAVRVIDGLPYVIPYLVGITATAANTRRQRLGDQLAGTLVMRKQ